MPKAKPTQQLLSDTGAINHLYRGDCLDVLDRIEDESVDLIYIDPPFFSQRYYETFWGEEAERYAFEDRWKGGINTYLNYLTARIRKMHAKLKPTGLMYVHLDWHICHYMKTEMDKIFGYGNFRNEIVWCYAGGGIPRQDFPRKHDVIFRYSKGDKYYYQPIYRPYTPGTVQRGRTSVKGKYFDRGLRAEGTPVNDWWTDIPKITSPTDPEKLGYPTQKSVALLNRIVESSARPGDLVLDAFCGCGTTLEAAQLFRCRWIGIDISQSALRVVQNRLRKIGAPPAEVHNMVQSVEELRALTWQEFQNWAVDAIQGRHSPRKVADMGIDGFTFMEHHPIQVKQMDAVGRPVIDNFVGVLDRQKDRRGIMIAFDFTKGAIGEVARLQREDKIDIELISCKQLIEEEIPFRQLA
jgi:DNA modification methylase